MIHNSSYSHSVANFHMAGFLIVKFIRENSVSVVPKSWLKVQEGVEFCAWPPYRMPHRLNAAIQNGETPAGNWLWIEVEVMKSVDTYEGGLEYEEMALYKSDLGTECEDNGRKEKRRPNKRKKISNFSSEEDEEDCSFKKSLPPPPKIGEKPIRTQQLASLDLQAAIPGTSKNYFPGTPHLLLSAPHPSPSTPHPSPSTLHPSPSIPHPFPSTPHPSPSASHPSPSTPHPSPSISHLSQSTPHQFPSTPHQILPSSSQNFLSGYERKVLRMLENIKQELRDIKQGMHVPQNSLPQLPPSCPRLPCQNPEDLADLEGILTEESTFVSICDYLSTIGGSSVGDSTKRVLRVLMTNKLSLKYNWKGTRGVKLGFASFINILKLILGAVRKNPNAASATEVEVAEVIKKWLMHAKDRDGGRNARASEKQAAYDPFQ